MLQRAAASVDNQLYLRIPANIDRLERPVNRRAVAIDVFRAPKIKRPSSSETQSRYGLDERPNHGHEVGRMILTTQRLKKETSMKGLGTKKELSPGEREELLKTLKARFEKNMNRHKGLAWAKVQAKLEANPKKLWSVGEMEKTGGEPDVVGHDKKTGEYTFFDCASESPKGRRSVCYDHEALEARKEHKPKDSAINMAAAMGIDILTAEEYRELQKLGDFDTKTSSWVKTPSEIRRLGGAIFCDQRYNHVFVYHNGAESYYGARAFRGSLRV